MAKKILIVDDDKNIVSLLVSRLRANGYDVVVAFDGVGAVSQAHKERPDLILLDIRMPGGGGASVYDNLLISSETMTIPIIFMTAYSEDEKFQKLVEGKAAYLVKPFDMNLAMAEIRKILGDAK
jgi:DNA-binding response OmpR family regulator